MLNMESYTVIFNSFKQTDVNCDICHNCKNHDLLYFKDTGLAMLNRDC